MEISYPSWLSGRFRVRSRLEAVTFPLGRGFLTQRVPGVRMASMLQLPNIGNAPEFELEFGNDSQGSPRVVRANRSLNAQNTLEAFWPDAHVKLVEAPKPGKLMLQYEGPTRSGVVTQNIFLQTCSSESATEVPGGPIDGDSVFFSSEVYQQDNVEQGARTLYQVLQTWQQSESDPDRVSSKQRIAAYLQPTDGRYMDAKGKPVALYDYAFELTRIRDAQ